MTDPLSTGTSSGFSRFCLPFGRMVSETRSPVRCFSDRWDSSGTKTHCFGTHGADGVLSKCTSSSELREFLGSEGRR